MRVHAVQVTLPLFRLILDASSEQGNGEVMVQLGIDRQKKVLQNRHLLVGGGLEGDRPALGNRGQSARLKGGERPQVLGGTVEDQPG